MPSEESPTPRSRPPINGAEYDPVTGLEVGVSVSSPITFGLLLHLEDRVQLDTSLDAAQLIAELDAVLNTMDENTGEIRC